MQIATIGTGYVGLVTGTCLADMGHEVVCQDIDSAKIAKLVDGHIPIYEPGLEELVRRNQRDGRLHFTTDLATALSRAEVCFVAVGTPADTDGSADRRFVSQAVSAIARAMNHDLLIVIKSTVPVGTCHQMRSLVGEILAERGVKSEYDVVSNPEFLKEGKAVEDFLRPDRIIVGADSPQSIETMQRLYEGFVRNGRPLLIMDVRSSEMSKYAANVMLATRISLMNELSMVCERVGADIMQVRKAIGSDGRIGMQFLYPGVGYGGSCFPKDVKALARLAIECYLPADILDAVDRVNRHQKITLANRIVSRFNGDLRGKRVALWGIAFKPDTDDVREAPALSMIKRLTEAGAEVVAYDPEAMDNARRELAGVSRVTFAPSMYDTLDGASALLIATEWRQFRAPDFDEVKRRMKEPLIFDGRNLFTPTELRARGFEYHCIGRPQL